MSSSQLCKSDTELGAGALRVSEVWGGWKRITHAAPLPVTRTRPLILVEKTEEELHHQDREIIKEKLLNLKFKRKEELTFLSNLPRENKMTGPNRIKW
eukprot:g54026.t1